MEIGTAGNDLQVSTTENGIYNYSITLGAITGKLVPVTYDNALKAFYKLVYNNTTGDYDYTVTGAGDKFTHGDSSVNQGYLEYDLFFKSATAGSVVKLDTTNSTILSQNASAKGAARVMIVTYAENNLTEDTVKIWESDTNADSTYGIGTYFSNTKPYIVYGSMESFFKVPEVGDTAYTLNATYLAKEYATIDGAAAFTIKTLGAANTPARVTVRIWLEGWDGDASNLASTGNPLKAYLKFLGNE